MIDLNKKYFIVNPNKGIKYKVLVLCITYNHKEYIAQAIEGFLAQKVDFSYHIVIVDDASQDGTSEVIRQYACKYPSMISAYIAKKNLYNDPLRKEYYSQIYKEFYDSDYIAICEGDDCWIDYNKLKIQVDFLEINPQYVMCTHNAIWEDSRTGEKRTYSPFIGNRLISKQEIVKNGSGNIATASFVMRYNLIFLDDKFPLCDVGDWPMLLFAITKGDVYYFEDKMSLYRYMHSGSWTHKIGNNLKNRINHRLGMIRFLQEYDRYSKNVFHNEVEVQIKKYFYLNVYDKEKEIPEEEYEKILLAEHTKTGLSFKIVNNILNIRKTLHDTNYIGFLQGCSDCESVYVYGIGEYSNLISSKLEKNGIIIQGYIVSDKSNTQCAKFRNAQVYSVDLVPKSFEDILVIFAMNNKWEYEMREIIAAYNISNYITPFWMDNAFEKK